MSAFLLAYICFLLLEINSMKNILFLILALPFLSISQNQIQGIILDDVNNKPLPFTTITTSENFGTLTDIDGKFSINAIKTITQISISYVGYESVIVPVSKNDKFLKISLKPKIESLREVQSMGLNPKFESIIAFSMPCNIFFSQG